MINRNFLLLFLLVFFIFFSSCKNDKKEDAKCVAQKEQSMEKEIVLLPDTVYASISDLEFRIDTFDTIHSGLITDFADCYAKAPGILTFRGGPFRDAKFNGKVSGRPDTVSLDWTFLTDYDHTITKYGTWGGGTGWTGQPLYVQWPDSCMQRFRKESPALKKSFSNREIIVGSLCGKVYFIDFETGEASRSPIDVQNNIKGTPSLDPTLNGNLYVGQGIPRQQPFGAATYNLYKHERTHFQGADFQAWRPWHAYDASPIRVGDFVFRVGENGTVYKYRCVDGEMQLHTTLRYRLTGTIRAAGIEASMAVYKNYGYITDNHGNIVCFNLNTLQPIWHYSNHDDSDSSPVLEEENGVPYLYSGCEVDKQHDTANYSYLVKLDARNGELVWEQPIRARRAVSSGHTFEGGLFATPLLGQGNCKDLIFYNLCTNIPTIGGEFVALNKHTGDIVYRTPLKWYPWSSPVALENEKGEMFVFTGDCAGRVYLIDAKTGEILFCRCMANNFEGSPIVVDNHVVVGSRGQEVYRFSVTSRNE